MNGSEASQGQTDEIDIMEVMRRIPHRPPFLLIDRAEAFVPGKTLTGVKNVTINEPFFQGHFPGAPVMPGVLIIEAMAQVGGMLLLGSLGIDPPRRTGWEELIGRLVASVGK